MDKCFLCNGVGYIQRIDDRSRVKCPDCNSPAEPVKDLAEPENPHGKGSIKWVAWEACASAYRRYIQALREQLAEANRKGGEVCNLAGNLMIEKHDLEAQVERLQKTCSNLIDFMARKGIDMEGESQLAAPKESQKNMVEGYWWCPECKEELTPHGVTYQELCAMCGTRVIWKSLAGGK